MVLASGVGGHDTKIEIVNQTTLEGLTRLIATEFSPVAILNFASARNPGGGFLKGSQAQEESLARSSALHSSLIKVFQFYEDHRNNSSSLYLDNMILSPDCPVFRNDDGDLLSEPQIATFITSPAPNAGATAENRPGEMGRIPEILQSRSELILALAASHGYKQLILGAWGCGVFRNSPSAVAKTFATHLLGAWAGRFQRVVFSVYDTSSAKETYSAFKAAFPATS